MDLSQFDTALKGEVGATMTVLSPADDSPLIDETTGEPVTITLLGADSPTYQSTMHRVAKSGREIRLGGRGSVQIDSQQVAANKIALLAACTKSWCGIVFEGQALACNEANAKRLYIALPWLREQVDAFVQDRSNFLGD